MGPFSLENTYIGYIQILSEELDHLRAMSWVRLCTRPISVNIDNRADPFSWIRLRYRQTGASRSETFDLSGWTLPPLSSRSYTSRQFRGPSRVAIQSRPRSCCTKRLLPRTRIDVEDTDEHNGDSTSDKKYGREYGPLNNQFHKRLKSNGF
jgi:hypothetical protein